MLMSDIDGLFTSDPHHSSDARLIEEVRDLSEDILSLGGGEGSSLGTGGMKTKLEAARICMEAGCDMIIMNGSKPELLYRILEGGSVGTRFYAKEKA